MHLNAAMCFAIVMSFAAVAPGQAQSQQGTSFSNGPINFTATSITNTPSGLNMRGKVELSQGENRFLADQMQTTVRDGEITRVVATGNVYLVTAGENIRGDAAVFTPETDLVEVTGDVILVQGKNVMTGSRMTYNLRTEVAQIEGGPTSSGQRVQGVFYPSGD